MEEALKYASKTLGRKVVRVLNPHPPTALYQAFMHVVVKNGSRNSSRLLDIVRGATEGMIKKASLGPRRCANLDGTTETLSIGSTKVDNVFEISKRSSDAPQDSEDEKGYKKAAPNGIRNGVHILTLGV